MSNPTYTNYFEFNLGDLAEGTYVVIEIRYAMCSYDGASSGFIAIVDELATPAEGDTSAAEVQTCTWAGYIGTDTEDGVLYLVYSAAMDIYSIQVTVYE